ncbi:MAG: M23 family metallopeptidase [Comamonadaceae bacterium]|nr:M23 family metallopeptidase [Comamonadaceae bacterium]
MGRGIRTVYAHLSIIIARERDTVRQGQAIGGVGDTGPRDGTPPALRDSTERCPRQPCGLLADHDRRDSCEGLSAPR